MNPIPFADDPVRGKPISLATGDVEGLDPGQWLSTSLVDYVLQTSLAGKLPDHVLIGSSNCSTYFHTYNSKLRNEDDTHCVQQMRDGLQPYAESRYRFISAACYDSHFFVVDITFDNRQPNVFERVNVFDSLSSTARRRATAVLHQVQKFLSGFCFYKLGHHQSVLQDPDYIMQMAEFRHCPVQTNGYDCGLFALAVVWHLLCDKDIHPSVFTQADIDTFRVQQVVEQFVEKCHTYDYEQKLYSGSFVPVCMDMLQPDQTTLPPDVEGKRMAGRPKTSSPTADTDWYRQRRYNDNDVKKHSRAQKQQQQQQQQRILQEYNVPTTKEVLKFAVPAISVWLCVPLMAMMDTSAVGSMAGTLPLAALNPAIAVISYSSKLVAFLFSGTTAIMAAAVATEKRNSTTTPPNRTTAKALLGILQFSTLVGVGLGLCLMIFAKPLLLALIGGKTVDPTLLDAASKYVQIRALGMPAAAMLGSAQTACLAKGDTKLPLYVTLVAGIVNFFLNRLLIRQSHTWIGGTAGAAWATSMSQYLTVVWLIRWLYSRTTTTTTSTTTKGLLSGRGISWKEMVNLPTKAIAMGFAPFVVPVMTTQAGRSSASATIDHVVTSSLSTASMAANQILTSVYYGLIPIVESLSLAAQSFVPSITERKVNNERNTSPTQQEESRRDQSVAMRGLYKSFAKASGICGLILATVIGTLPLYVSVFTPDMAVRQIVTTVVPLIFLTSLKHGFFCASEGILLGQKDLRFLGAQYSVYTFLIPYILLQVKRAALEGTRSVNLASVWQIFVGYDFFRTLLMILRIGWLDRRRSKDSVTTKYGTVGIEK
ncbi:MATE efflux family protein [Nitzschia inconspicua]|uniref:MATE efflux family protein n=1 Tax=Nitzschia inconspicua TaxID=303405 RepID=A0A9K3L374_9STRA|nr:MATE efflux family protein [Nitzschia inconspicua]